MTFEQLKLFRDIAQTRSMSQGARMNEISQSAATQHVQELERSLGTLLLDRSTRPLSVTAAGRVYSDFCRDVLRRREELEARLQELKSQVEGEVRVAAIYSVGLTEMTRLEEEFRRLQPGCRLSVEYLRPEKVYQALLEERADLGLVSYPIGTREISILPWREEEMVVAAAPSHPLARRHTVHPSHLAGCDFVGFDEDLPIRREIDRYLREHGVEVDVVMHFDVIEMVKRAVALGSGISIVPARIMRAETEAGTLVAVRLRPVLYRPLGILLRKKRRLPRAAEAFLDLLKKLPEPELALR